MTEDEMVGWHYWLDGHKFVQTPGVGNVQGILVCCSPWGCKELDTTEWIEWNCGPCGQFDSFSVIVVFVLSAHWWISIRVLWKLPDGRDWLRGKPIWTYRNLNCQNWLSLIRTDPKSSEERMNSHVKSELYLARMKRIGSLGRKLTVSFLFVFNWKIIALQCCVGSAI